MLVSLELIYYGDCRDMIAFYLANFENATAEIRTYHEMPLAEVLGIKEPEINMIWRAGLTIQYGNYALRFKLSDSLLIARRGEVNCKEQVYHPLVCIEHPDEQYVHDLLERLYCGEHCLEEIQKGIYSDKYGIRWIYKKSECRKIYHCLEFMGNCDEVAAYIGNAYQAQLSEVVTYADSLYANSNSECREGQKPRCPAEGVLTAKDKIYSAFIEFRDDNSIYALKFSDGLGPAMCDDRGYGGGVKIWYQIIIVVNSSDEIYLKESFERLSERATLNRPISLNEEGILYGSMIDRYGIVWELFGG